MESAEEMRKVIQEQPGYAEAHYHLAIGLRNKGQIREAVDELRTALKLKPHYPEAHNVLGRI